MTVALDGKSSIPNVTYNLIGAFNASSNISMTMDNVATGLTNYFHDSSNITVAGQSGEVDPCELALDHSSSFSHHDGNALFDACRF